MPGREDQWQWRVPVDFSWWQPFLSVPPEWAHAPRLNVKATNANAIFFISFSSPKNGRGPVSINVNKRYQGFARRGGQHVSDWESSFWRNQEGSCRLAAAALRFHLYRAIAKPPTPSMSAVACIADVQGGNSSDGLGPKVEVRFSPKRTLAAREKLFGVEPALLGVAGRRASL